MAARPRNRQVSSTSIKDITWRDSHNLDRHLVACDWVRHSRTVPLTGVIGTGKTWMDCALARHAARCGFSVLYARTTRLMQELHVAHGEGGFARRLAQLARVDVLLLNDFAGAPMNPGERGDPLGQLDDRVGTKATLATSQLTVDKWLAWFGRAQHRRCDPRPHRALLASHRAEGAVVAKGRE